MNEIEKMYKNAGVEPKKCWQSCMDCKEKTKTHYNEYGEEFLTCDRFEDAENCPYAKKYYPIFTADKQLELIKWTIKTNRRYFIQDIIADDFSKTLAGVFNLYWQDLTEEEKEEIKEILE